MRRTTIASWLMSMTLAIIAAQTFWPAVASITWAQAAPANNEPATIPNGGSQPDFDPDAATKQAIQQLSIALSDPYTPPADREEAARRLLVQSDPIAKAALLSALREGSVASVAVARALADSFKADPDFIEPLFASFGANRNLTEAAAAALANYRANGAVLARLIETATNRQRSVEEIRLAAIRALGSFSEKRSAEALITLIRNPNESQRIRARAGSALASLSGIDEEMDARRWDEWWNANSRRGEDEFRAEMLNRKGAFHERDQSQIAQLADALKASLRTQYSQTPQDSRDELLIAWLRSNVPDVRAYAAQQIYEDFLANQPVAASGYDELRKMIGDSSPIVRRQVVQALGVKNDRASLEPLLVQLSQETDPAVRQQIAIALQSITDVRAAPALVKLLDDPSPSVVLASVRALQPLGKAILEQRPPLATTLAASLQRIIERTAQTDQVELRADAITALVPLKQRELVRPLYLQMLKANEDPRVRIAALQALGEIGDRNTAAAVIEQINDRDDTVVLQAVKTLGRLAPTPDEANALLPLLIGDRVRPDPTIKEEAWHVLESILPSMTNEQLTNMAEKFRGDPRRQIAIRLQLAKVLTAQKALEDLAITQSQIARNYMEQKEFDSALPFFRAALEFRQGNREAGAKVDELIDGYMQAALQSNAFNEAIAFAQKTLARDAGQQATIGSRIRSRVEDLNSSASLDDVKRAAELIKLAKTMNPPLGERYLSDLSDLQKSVEQKLANANQGSMNPRPASGVATPMTTRPTGALAGDGGN